MSTLKLVTVNQGTVICSRTPKYEMMQPSLLFVLPWCCKMLYFGGHVYRTGTISMFFTARQDRQTDSTCTPAPAFIGKLCEYVCVCAVLSVLYSILVF